MNDILRRMGGYALVKDPGGSAEHIGRAAFQTNLKASVIRGGEKLTAKQMKKLGIIKKHRPWHGSDTELDFGSGKVTEMLVVALAKDFVGTTNNKQAPILTQLSRMFSGTSSTVEQSYDYGLGTAVNIASGAITPTLAVVASSNNASMQYVGTIAYNSTFAVVEWGLFAVNANGSQYNTSTNTNTATTLTPTTNPSWSANQWSPGYVVIAGTSSGTANQSGASYYGALIESNSSTALTIAQASNDGISYWTVNNNGGPGSTPGNNTRWDIWPFMADHKTFSAINVVNGDSIQFTYTLTIQSGG